jgi:hypothetical protein
MHIYMAAVYANSYMPGQNRFVKLTEHEKHLVTGVPHILESYHYVQKQKFVDEMRLNQAKVFLDSGAFSAFTLGVKLSIDEYCAYIWNNWDIIRFEDGIMMASVLDGIGDAQLTYENQLAMEARGVRPLPCFHAGEDLRYLDWYVRNYDYITLGGMVGSSTQALIVWLDRVWDRLLDGAGRPKIKVHGFGITSVELMERYEWYSCDSSSWIQTAAFGNVLMPEGGVDKDGHRRIGYQISTSEKSPSRHDWNQHVMNLDQESQNYVFQTLEKQGFTYERLATVYESRAAYNLWSFGVINALIDESRRRYPRTYNQDLFKGLTPC